MLDRAEAEKLLVWAGNKNPGKWVQHSYNAARAAELIAHECYLEGDAAYVLGLLHDIGRYEGPTNLRHVYAGYKLMKEKGYDDIAKICLTHSFPYKDFAVYQGTIDCTVEEVRYLKDELEKTEYDDYDKLIQLCDGICLAEGITLMEVRIVDVVRRYGYNEKIIAKWNAMFEIKKYFDQRCRKNIYELFREEITQNIFGA